MFGGTKMFRFAGTSLTDRGYSAIEQNLEEYYYQLRTNGYVPIFGTEDIEFGDDFLGQKDWEMSIIGKECDNPWDVRGVTTEGAIEWFTTPKDTSSQYSTQSA